MRTEYDFSADQCNDLLAIGILEEKIRAEYFYPAQDAVSIKEFPNRAKQFENDPRIEALRRMRAEIYASAPFKMITETEEDVKIVRKMFMKNE